MSQLRKSRVPQIGVGEAGTPEGVGPVVFPCHGVILADARRE
jgi:hypothetical protein